MSQPNPYQTTTEVKNGTPVSARVFTFAILAATVFGFVALNVFPPAHYSFDPWACRSISGVSEVRDYGWPWHFRTVFISVGNNNETVLTLYSSLLLNLACIVLIGGLMVASPLLANRIQKRSS